MKILLSALLTVLILFACKSQQKDFLVTLHTEYGDISMVLYDQTPKHKKNFIKLAKSGAFDSTTFHRVINNFMIQGGDVNAKPGNEKEINYTIPPEFVDTLIHHRGALAAARQGDFANPGKESNGSQFYIVQGMVFPEWQLTADMKKVSIYLPKMAEVAGYDTILSYLQQLHQSGNYTKYHETVNELIPKMEERFDVNLRVKIKPERLRVYTTMGGTPHLDDTYTVFGRVVEGMEVVEKIGSLPTDSEDKPHKDVYLTVSLEEMPKEEWSQKYGGRGY